VVRTLVPAAGRLIARPTPGSAAVGAACPQIPCAPGGVFRSFVSASRTLMAVTWEQLECQQQVTESTEVRLLRRHAGIRHLPSVGTRARQA